MSERLEARLEKDVRNPSIKLAKAADVLHKRMHFGYGAAGGWPDDLFLFKNGHHWWVEFKRPGGEATELQKEVHRQMQARGVDISVIDSYENFVVELALRRHSNG